MKNSKLLLLALTAHLFTPDSYCGSPWRTISALADNPANVTDFKEIYRLIQPQAGGFIAPIVTQKINATYSIGAEQLAQMSQPQIDALTDINQAINGAPGTPAVWNPALAAPAGAVGPTGSPASAQPGGFATIADAQNFGQNVTTFGEHPTYLKIFPSGNFYSTRAQEQIAAWTREAGRVAGVAEGTSVTEATFLRDAIGKLLPATANVQKRRSVASLLPTRNAAELGRTYTNLLNDLIVDLLNGRAYLNVLRKTYDPTTRSLLPDPLPAYVAGTRIANVENPNMTMHEFMDKVFANQLRSIFYTPAATATLPALFPSVLAGRSIFFPAVANINNLNPDSAAGFQETAATAFDYIVKTQRQLFQVNDMITRRLPTIAGNNLVIKLTNLFADFDRQVATQRADFDRQIATERSNVAAGGRLSAPDIQVLIANHNRLVSKVFVQIAALLPFYNDGPGGQTVDQRIDAILAGRFHANQPIENDVALSPAFVLAFGANGLKSVGPTPQFRDIYEGTVDGFKTAVRTKVANGLSILLRTQVSGCNQSAQILRQLSHDAIIQNFVVANAAGPLNLSAITPTTMGANLQITVQPVPTGAAPVPPVPVPVPPVPAPGPISDHNLALRAAEPRITSVLFFCNTSQNEAALDAFLNSLNLVGTGPLPAGAATASRFTDAFGTAADGTAGLNRVFGSGDTAINRKASLATLKFQLARKAKRCLLAEIFPTIMAPLMQAATRLKAANPAATVNTFSIVSTVGSATGPLSLNPPPSAANMGNNITVTIVPEPAPVPAPTP